MKRIVGSLVKLFLGAASVGLLGACGASTSATPTLSFTLTSTASPVPTDTATPAPTFTPTETPLPPLGIGSTMVSPQDGMTLMYIPAGDFLMGNDDIFDEGPLHAVYISAFWMDKTEVTNAMYKQCVEAGICHEPSYGGSYSHSWYYGNAKYADYPVIFVSLVDASNYCAWTGRRLPTEAEWEKAARGTDGRIYPWGNNFPVCALANFTADGRTCTGDPAPADSYPNGASPYGVLNMAGNVMEWVNDRFDPAYYRTASPSDPQGPDNSDYRVVRGGSWYTDASALRVTNRNIENPYNTYDTLGFRCALSAAP